jgi:signal transduction histidine kinase/ActR/RegA family two-component response regulator
MNPAWQLIALLVAAVLLIVQAFLIWRRRSGTSALNMFAFLLVLAAAWSALAAIDLETPALAQKVLLFRIRFLFIPFMAPLLIETIYQFARGRRLLTGTKLAVALFIPLVTVGLVALPGIDPFFRYDFRVDYAGPFPVLHWTNGPWGFVFMVYSNALAVWGLFLLVQLTWHSHGKARMMNGCLVVFFLAPFLADWAYLLGWSPTPGFNYMPVVFALSAFALSLAIVRYRFLDLAPVARSQLVELLKEILIVLDAENRVVDLNEAAAQALGVPAEKAMNEPVDVLLARWPEVRALLKEKNVAGWDTVIEREGKSVAHECSILTVPGREANPGSRILLLHNISERKLMEAELQRAKEAAEASLEAKARFLAMMSHEIRTPLNGVIGFAGMLEKTTLTADQQEYVNLISRSSELLLVIINDILDYSKIEAGRVDLDENPFGLKAEVEKTCLLLALRAKEKGLKLEWKIDADVPPRLVGDSVRLGQILTNLIGNAIKFTAEGEVTVRVQLVSAPHLSPEERHRIAFIVQDTGIGLSRQAMMRLFQPFSQADSSTARQYGGTGLGLAICRRLSEAMGGSIAVESELGKGSTFTCVLALRSIGPETIAEEAHKQASARLSSLPLQVLVVEDNEINQRVVAALLKRMGHQTVFADDGFKCLELVGTRHFDAVLMDISMPGMDGFETVRRLRAKEKEAGLPRTRVIALTAHAIAGNRDRCLEGGMDDFLAKPINSTLLKSILESTAHSHKTPA